MLVYRRVSYTIITDASSNVSLGEMHWLWQFSLPPLLAVNGDIRQRFSVAEVYLPISWVHVERIKPWSWILQSHYICSKSIGYLRCSKTRIQMRPVLKWIYPKTLAGKKKHLKRGKASTNGCEQGILDCQVSLLGDKWSRKPRRNGRAKIRHHTKTLQLAHSGVMFVKGKPMLQLGWPWRLVNDYWLRHIIYHPYIYICVLYTYIYM